MHRYFTSLAATFLSAVAVVALLNVAVDANGVYRTEDASSRQFIADYVTRLRSSPDGLVYIAAERHAKVELARQSSADCYVQGSSHVMQIDAVTAPQLFGHCRAVVNLGVSGSSFEDFVAMAGLLAEREFRGYLLVGVGPWMFRREADPRWSEERAAYERGRIALRLSKASAISHSDDARWSNLFNADYALHNARALLRRPKSPAAARELQYGAAFEAIPAKEAGEKDAIFFPSGRFEYARNFLAKTPPAPAAVGDGGYKIGPIAIEPAIAAEFETALRTLLDRGMTVALLLTPYHPFVMPCTGRNVCETLSKVETDVRKMAKRLGIPLMGSYDPRPLGLGPADYLDQMHIAKHALARLGVVEQDPWQAKAQ